MKRNPIITLAILAGSALFAISAYADSDEVVNGYVHTTDGKDVTSSSGECVRTNIKNAKIEPGKCGYVKESPIEVEVVAADTAVTVTATKDEKVVIRGSILFAFDSAELTDDGKAVILERILMLGHKKNQAAVKVEGHTDSSGSDEYNQALSERRAKSVASFIEQMKESPDTHIEAVGMGESSPVESNDTKDGRAMNRRVEITVVGLMHHDKHNK